MRLIVVIVLLGLAGCQLFAPGERWEDAPELRSALVEADEYIVAHFGKRFCDLDAIGLYWADETCAMEGNIIFINRTARGNADLIAVYMRHELFHLTTGLRDREAVYYNGVRIADWIAYGMAKQE